MYYGLYLSASGVLVNSHNQDVFANNLANAQTPGFKPVVPGVRQRPAESVEDLVPFDAEHPLLDKLGGGVLASPLGLNFTPGAKNKTGQPLDVALINREDFFAVQATDDRGAPSLRLTRNGRFTMDREGFLTTANGMPVLNINDQPIQVNLEDGLIRINERGQILQADEVIEEIQVARVPDPGQKLFAAGQGLFQFEGRDPRVFNDDPQVLPQHTEASGANMFQTMMSLVASTKAANSNARLIRYQDSMMDRAVNTLGRVA